MTSPAAVVLVGLPGAGKSTIGRILARRTGRTFVDLDAEIERGAGASVTELFAREGESGFRRREADATLALRPVGPIVVAAGGGWMARPEIRDAWPGAVRVWLRVSPEVAAERLAGTSTRPILANQSPLAVLHSLRDARLPSYRLAEYTVDTDDRTPVEVADAVAEALGLESGGAGAADSGQDNST